LIVLTVNGATTMVIPDKATEWKSVVDLMAEGVMLIDQTGKIVWLNRSLLRLTGYPYEELIGMPCSILTYEMCQIELCEKAEHGWCSLFRDGCLDGKRGVLARKDGVQVPILKNASILRDAEGKITGAVETITDISQLVSKEHEIQQLHRQTKGENSFRGIVGASACINAVFDMIRKAAVSDAPVIILGDSGTGKELVADAIHDLGPRKDKPFIKVNCSALTESLLETELFGHVKGAYTGAYRSREGRFEAAKGGDIFLDEIGDLPLNFQVKLLRTLEQKIIQRVGSNADISVDFRLITATNRNLRELVSAGRFREDLFFRLNVIPIELAPLRRRNDDLILLMDYFMNQGRVKTGKKIMSMTQEARDAMLHYHWPGNVRELRSALEYIFVVCNDQSVKPWHLPHAIVSAPDGDRKIPSKPSSGENKKNELIKALKKFGGNRSQAARQLGVSRITIWKWINKFGITTEDI
jgi:PAS domain S-box-containing protein